MFLDLIIVYSRAKNKPSSINTKKSDYKFSAIV